MTCLAKIRRVSLNLLAGVARPRELDKPPSERRVDISEENGEVRSHWRGAIRLLRVESLDPSGNVRRQGTVSPGTERR